MNVVFAIDTTVDTLCFVCSLAIVKLLEKYCKLAVQPPVNVKDRLSKPRFDWFVIYDRPIDSLVTFVFMTHAHRQINKLKWRRP